MKSINVHAEIDSERFDENFDILIVAGQEMKFLTTIPFLNGEKVRFLDNEELKINYYFGDLMYSVDVVYLEKLQEKNELYTFFIKEIRIDNNKRTTKRKNVKLRGTFWDGEIFNLCDILDMSESGLKIKTEKCIHKEDIIIYYGIEGKPISKRAKIVWNKEEYGVYFYGLQFI